MIYRFKFQHLYLIFISRYRNYVLITLSFFTTFVDLWKILSYDYGMEMFKIVSGGLQ